MGITLNIKDKAKAEDIMRFVQLLTPEKQRNFQIFIQGFEFAQAIAKKGPAA